VPSTQRCRRSKALPTTPCAAVSSAAWCLYCYEVYYVNLFLFFSFFPEFLSAAPAGAGMRAFQPRAFALGGLSASGVAMRPELDRARGAASIMEEVCSLFTHTHTHTHTNIQTHIYIYYIYIYIYIYTSLTEPVVSPNIVPTPEGNPVTYKRCYIQFNTN